MMEQLKHFWEKYEVKHPKISKWVREGGLFVIFSNAVTVVQYIIFTTLPYILGDKFAAMELKWPAIPVEILGVDFTWNIFGYDVKLDKLTGEVLIGGGAGAFIAMLADQFIAQVINFPLQRNYTFRSKGNPVYQAIWYFIAWLVITPIVNSIDCVWRAFAEELAMPNWMFTIGSTILVGGISMVVFFFVFKIIFPEGEAKKK